MNKRDIQKIVKKYPCLTTKGFGVEYRTGEKSEDTRKRVKEAQQKLLESAEICTKICEWLKDVIRTKRPNKQAGSYTMKHEVENAIGEYCSNGQFICAAIHMGFIFDCNGINACFNISSRCIHVKQKAQMRQWRKDMRIK